jgi:hypothetical protein
MKIKIILTFVSLMIGTTTMSNAAILAISNVGDLSTDTLYAYNDGSLMNTTNGGVVTIGYFTAGVSNSSISTVLGLYSNLSNFTVVSTFEPGSFITSLNGAYNGYADNTGDAPGSVGGVAPASIGQLTTGNPLIGRNYYSIITNASSLSLATIASQFGLVLLGQLPNEDAGEITLTSNPVSGPVGTVGTTGAYNGDVGFGSGTYQTLKLAVVPEPSAALLGAVGLVGLLRRRRI